MFCISLGNIDINLKWLDEGINKNVPAGREFFESRQIKFEKIKELKCFRDLKESKKFERQIGTLGGGNHFIELDVDDSDNKYLVIHTGSRNLGNQVAEYYQKLAIKLHSGYDEVFKKQQEIIDTYKAQGRKSEIQEAIKQLHRETKLTKPDMPNDLCYLENNYRDDYLHDMRICQEYAVCNRELIAKNIIEKVINPMLKEELIYDELDKFQTIHNYINFDDNIVRKGAISAKKGERVLIPINMRDGSIIATGKGNEDWNQSAPHGAGRLMSRNKAKEMFNLEEFKETMKDVYSSSVVEETIDEAPFCYKSMQEIIDNIQDTVEIERIIRPLYNFKAKS